AERLSVYRTAVGDDLERAIRLYEWNRDLASALGATLGDVEVVVRNAMHEQLTAWSTSRHGQPWWYLDPGAVLTDRATKDITKARDRATYDGKPETPGRVVAELGFGFGGTCWPAAMTGCCGCHACGRRFLACGGVACGGMRNT